MYLIQMISDETFFLYRFNLQAIFYAFEFKALIDRPMKYNRPVDIIGSYS